MAGRPKGSKNDKFWTDAIRMEAMRDVESDDGKKIKRLRRVANKLFAAAEDGDVAAMREIGDRLDGKPQQSVDVDAEVGVTIVRNTIYEAKPD